MSSLGPDTVGRLTGYKVLVVLRVLLCIVPLSYIHPDEYFQNQEVTSSDVFDTRTQIPWEFAPETGDIPSRSVLFPFLSSGFPFFLLRIVNELVSPYGYTGRCGHT